MQKAYEKPLKREYLEELLEVRWRSQACTNSR